MSQLTSLANIALIALLLHRVKRSRRRISNICLPLEEASAWNVLWSSQNDDGMVHMTGLDCMTFRILHNAIAPHLYSFRRGRGGRISRLDTYATTALGLYYLNSTTPIKSLCQIFGAPLATTQRALLRALGAIAKYAHKIHEARIKWPSPVIQTALSICY